MYKSPIGALKLVANSEGICAVKWLFGKHAVSHYEVKEDNNLDRVTEKISAETSQPNEHLRVCQRWLDAYFEGSLLSAQPAIPTPPLVLPNKSTNYNNFS